MDGAFSARVGGRHDLRVAFPGNDPPTAWHDEAVPHEIALSGALAVSVTAAPTQIAGVLAEAARLPTMSITIASNPMHHRAASSFAKRVVGSGAWLRPPCVPRARTPGHARGQASAD